MATKKTQERKELEAAALFALARRLEGRVTKLTRALESLKKKAKGLLASGRKKTGS